MNNVKWVLKDRNCYAQMRFEICLSCPSLRRQSMIITAFLTAPGVFICNLTCEILEKCSLGSTEEIWTQPGTEDFWCKTVNPALGCKDRYKKIWFFSLIKWPGLSEFLICLFSCFSSCPGNILQCRFLGSFYQVTKATWPLWMWMLIRIVSSGNELPHACDFRYVVQQCIRSSCVLRPLG